MNLNPIVVWGIDDIEKELMEIIFQSYHITRNIIRLIEEFKRPSNIYNEVKYMI